MDISYIKFLSQKAGVTLIKQNQFGLNIKFAEEVNIDGSKLFMLANEYLGKLKIIDKDGIMLKYAMTDFSAETVNELLMKVAHCKMESNLV